MHYSAFKFAYFSSYKLRLTDQIQRTERRKGKVVWLQIQDFIGNLSQPRDSLVRLLTKKNLTSNTDGRRYSPRQPDSVPRPEEEGPCRRSESQREGS